MPSINLIPPEMLNHRRRVRRGRRWLVGVGIAYTLALIPWLREEQAKAELAEAYHVMDTLDRSLDAMRGATQASRAERTMQSLDMPIGAGDDVDGDLTLADVLLYCFLAFGAGIGQTVPAECKNLTAWQERMAARPSAAA